MLSWRVSIFNLHCFSYHEYNCLNICWTSENYKVQLYIINMITIISIRSSLLPIKNICLYECFTLYLLRSNVTIVDDIMR